MKGENSNKVKALAVSLSSQKPNTNLDDKLDDVLYYGTESQSKKGPLFPRGSEHIPLLRVPVDEEFQTCGLDSFNNVLLNVELPTLRHIINR